MCISAQASFTVAAGLVTIGAFAINKAKSPAMKLLAFTPILFAMQQALEGIVWLSISSTPTANPLHTFSVYSFIMFAGCAWPMWIPGVLYAIEKDQMRKKMLFVCLLVGAIVASLTLISLLLFGATASAGDHIQYTIPLHGIFTSTFFSTLQTPLYLFATVLPLFVASTWRVWLIGFVITLGYFVANTFYAVAFASMWCFIAALASMLVYRVVTKRNEEVLL